MEPAATYDYRGITVCKTGPWGSGPVALQQLALLEGFDLQSLSEAELVHVVTECAKLAFADRDALYGDADVPLDTLLSRDYNDARRALVADEAVGEVRAGAREAARVSFRRVERPAPGEPTRGDTVHLDVVDRWGNMVSATPSGGWLQSSPVIPSLGWPLGTRAQMFWLEEGLASSLRPGARPRTTLSPGLALRQGEPWLAWGTPGGDQQEQWALHVFLRHVDRGMNLQEAIDAPEFHTDHLISSFFPRGFEERSLCGRGSRRRGRGRRAPRARPRRDGLAGLVARPRHRGRPGARRDAEGRRQPPRPAGLRGRPLRPRRRHAVGQPAPKGESAAPSTGRPDRCRLE